MQNNYLLHAYWKLQYYIFDKASDVSFAHFDLFWQYITFGHVDISICLYIINAS